MCVVYVDIASYQLRLPCGIYALSDIQVYAYIHTHMYIYIDYIHIYMCMPRTRIFVRKGSLAERLDKLSRLLHTTGRDGAEEDGSVVFDPLCAARKLSRRITQVDGRRRSMRRRSQPRGLISTNFVIEDSLARISQHSLSLSFSLRAVFARRTDIRRAVRRDSPSCAKYSIPRTAASRVGTIISRAAHRRIRSPRP